jgi:outer membrane biosynthesis protein TonB
MPKAARVLLLALVVSAPLTVTVVASSTRDPSLDSVLRHRSAAAPVLSPVETGRLGGAGRIVAPSASNTASVDGASAELADSAPAAVAKKKVAAVPSSTAAPKPKPKAKPKPKPKAKPKPKSKSKAKKKPKTKSKANTKTKTKAKKAKAKPKAKAKSKAKKAKAKPKAKSKSKSKSKAKSKATPKTKAKTKKKSKPKKHYPHHAAITSGHYIRSLRNNVDSTARMWALGAADAARNRSHAQYLVLLDIGGQVPGGVMLSTTHRVVSYRTLQRDIGAYLRGYHARQHSDAPVIVAIGTNNDLHVSTRVGQIWARDLVNPLVAYVQRKHMKGITIAGANDIEPGFSAGPKVSEQWVHGFLMSTHAQLVFNGSADGCSTGGSVRCANGWTTVDLAFLAGAMAPGRILALPQIYNYTMAAQWAHIAQTAVRHSRVKLQIVGPLTENAACGRDPYCPTMPTWHAWSHLQYHLLRAGLPGRTPPIAVDLDVR